MNIIEFPFFGARFEIDPIAVRIPFLGGGIRWYAIFIVTGIIIASWVCFREYKRLGQDPDNLYNIIIISIPIAIVFARLYYVLFSPNTYKSFWDIISVWEGGLAIYGGVIGAAVVVALYCKKKKLSTLLHFDIGAYGFMIGQMIGRLGNFVNGEAFGYSTDLPWRMVVNGITAHPTFLYEILWNLVGFIIIWNTRKRNYFRGRSGVFYLIWYGIGRALIEMLRTDSLMIGDIRVSSALSVVFVLLGAGTYFYLKHKTFKKEAGM